jgi:hypothetical protein
MHFNFFYMKKTQYLSNIHTYWIHSWEILWMLQIKWSFQISHLSDAHPCEPNYKVDVLWFCLDITQCIAISQPRAPFIFPVINFKDSADHFTSTCVCLMIYLTICCSHRKSEKTFHLPRRNSWVHWFWCKRAFNWFTMEPNATTADSSGRFKSIWYCLHEILLFF